MRVLHVVAASLPQAQNGYTIRTQRLVEAQQRQGVEAVVLSADTSWVYAGLPDYELNGVTYKKCSYRDPLHDEDALLAKLVEEVSVLDSGAPGRSARLARLRGLRFRSRVSAVIEPDAPNFDVVHTHAPWHTALPAMRESLSQGIPACFELRGLQDLSAIADGKHSSDDVVWRDWWQSGRDDCLGLADRVFAISNGLADFVEARGFGRPIIARNGVNLDEWAEPPGVSESLGPQYDYRARHDIPHNVWLVGYAGAIRPLEGLELLVKAVRKLRQRPVVPPVHLLITGQRSDSWIEDVVRDHGLWDVTHFTGPHLPEQMPACYRAMDCFVVPREDSMVTRVVTPIKPLEAAACGVPVVITDLPALREVSPPSAAVAAPRVLPLAEAIWSALTTNMGLQASDNREFLKTRTWDITAATQIAAYEELIK